MKFFITLIAISITLISNGQSSRIYHLNNYITPKGDTCFCYLINGDTVNCLDNDRIKNGKWIHYNRGMHCHTDFVPAGQYEYYDSYSSLISNGQYIDNEKIGEWIFYSSNDNWKEQIVERIAHFHKGIKDSIELIIYPDSTYITNVYWNNSKIDSMKTFHNDSLVLFVRPKKQYDLFSFQFYEDSVVKYKWELDSTNTKNYIIQIDSLGIENMTFKKRIEEILPSIYFDIFMKVF